VSSIRNAARLEAVSRKLEALHVEGGSQSRDFTEYAEDPVRFAVEILGMQSATRRSDGTAYQFEILDAVQGHSRTAIRAGHGVGKTASLAMLSLWWLITRPYSRVVVVAPQYERQVRGVLFAELRKVARRSKVPLPVEVLAGKAVVSGFGNEWGIVGLPATEPDRIEGQHAEGGLLLVMDETKGVPQDSFDALMGALTGGEDSRLVVASTPGGTAGPFYRACERGLFHVVHLSSEDSSIVSPMWCEERAAEWGKESQLYTTRVQGEFADAGDGQLFGLSLLEGAIAPIEVPPTADVIFGVDVARSIAGDQSCICITKGGRVERFILWRSPDLMVTVQRVMREALLHTPKLIRVDVGGVGAGVVDRLRELRFRRVEAVHFGGAAKDTARFRNERAEMYWLVREALERHTISLPDDDELLADLSAIRYTFTGSGLIQLEAKDETRRRLGRSPDRADALALAVSARPARSRPRAVRPFEVPPSSFDPLAQPTPWLGSGDYDSYPAR